MHSLLSYCCRGYRCQVLTPRCFDQPVDGVVGVIGPELDALILEADRLLRLIADVGDVPDWVVGVAEVLQPAPESIQPQTNLTFAMAGLT